MIQDRICTAPTRVFSGIPPPVRIHGRSGDCLVEADDLLTLAAELRRIASGIAATDPVPAAVILEEAVAKAEANATIANVTFNEAENKAILRAFDDWTIEQRKISAGLECLRDEILRDLGEI